MEKNIAFRKFPSREAAEDLKLYLEEHGIAATLSDVQNEFTDLYLGSITHKDCEVQLKRSDFEAAEALLAANINGELATVTKDYYLYEYTNEELFGVLEKYDEWSYFDYRLAQKILSERGKMVTPEILSGLKYKRLKALTEPESVEPFWMIMAYISAFLGGFFGIVFGRIIMTATKSLPDGNKVFTYTVKDRAHGKTIFYIGLIIAAAVLIMCVLRVSPILD